MDHLQELVAYTGYLSKSLGRYFTEKGAYSAVVWVFGFLFGFEMNSALLALLVLMVFDLITGMMRAVRDGEIIRSRTALRSAIKLGVYSMLISSTHLVEMMLPGSTVMDEGMVIFLALTELISILENAGRMGFAIPQVLLTKLLSFEWLKPAKLEDIDKLKNP
jgi:toxin secretion/phage lysis holin